MAKTKTAKELATEMKAEVKSWLNKDTLDKIKRTLEYLIAPVCGVLSIWGIDGAVYVTAGMGILVSIVAFIELFVKE